MNDPRNAKSSAFFSPTAFRDLVSGRRRGAMAAGLRTILAAAEVPYTWAVRWRNRSYDCGANTVYRVDVPVISVGNLTLGGTGKTPMVEWIVRWFLAQGKKVGIISRGYGTRGGPNDEARELAWKLPGVPHVQDPDRVAAARKAIEERGCQVLVLDDAFQHRRIGRDLDIVLLDALEPLGYEHVFPRGTLREPVEGLSRAHVVALSRADLLTAAQENQFAIAWPSSRRRRCGSRPCMHRWHWWPRSRKGRASYSPRSAVVSSSYSPRSAVVSSSQQPLETLRGRRVLAFCGLGNPAGFRHTLEVCGYDVVEFHEFPDHHAYSPDDLNTLAAAARQIAAEALVCTQKDLVKIGTDRLADRPLWAIRVGIDFLAGREAFERQLLNCDPRGRSSQDMTRPRGLAGHKNGKKMGHGCNTD